MARMAVQPLIAATSFSLPPKRVPAGTLTKPSRKFLNPVRYSGNYRPSQLPRANRDVQDVGETIWNPEYDDGENSQSRIGLGIGKRRARGHTLPNLSESRSKAEQIRSAPQQLQSNENPALCLHAQEVPMTDWIANAVSKDLEGRLLVYALHPKYPATGEFCPTELEPSLYIICRGSNL